MRRYNPNVLYHSDVYLGQDYSDGIRHWKYIKREMKNGKWVYYYNDADLNKATNKYNKAIKNQTKAMTKNFKANKEISDYNDSFFKRRSSKAHKKALKAKATASEAIAEYRQAERDAYDAENQMKLLNKKDKIRKTLAKSAVKVANAQSDINEKDKKKVKKVLKSLNKTKNKVVDEARYQKAKITKSKTYKDTSGRIRLTKATKLGREKVDMKKTSEAGYSAYTYTKKGLKQLEEYKKIKAKEDSLNAKKKKKK